MANLQTIKLLTARLERLTPLQLDAVERLVCTLEYNQNRELPTETFENLDWPHAPLHRSTPGNVVLVTGGTLNKQHFFRASEHLDLMQSTLLEFAKECDWQLEAWACFSNHYHFIARMGEQAVAMNAFIQQFHSKTATKLNNDQKTKGRTVWFNYFDTALTYYSSYLARLNYVHQNAVRHGLVKVANQYKWCSAAWFERTATPAQVKTIYSFKTDRVQVPDDFDVE